MKINTAASAVYKKEDGCFRFHLWYFSRKLVLALVSSSVEANRAHLLSNQYFILLL